MTEGDGDDQAEKAKLGREEYNIEQKGLDPGELVRLKQERTGSVNAVK
jgi:hypothetical protein